MGLSRMCSMPQCCMAAIHEVKTGLQAPPLLHTCLAVAERLPQPLVLDAMHLFDMQLVNNA